MCLVLRLLAVKAKKELASRKKYLVSLKSLVLLVNGAHLLQNVIVSSKDPKRVLSAFSRELKHCPIRSFGLSSLHLW